MLPTATSEVEDKSYHHGNLQQALVDAGREVLATDGLSALNLRTVAKKAGVSHAAPYRHYADKDALIAAIAVDGLRQLGRDLQATIEHATDPIHTTQQMARVYVKFALQHPDLFRIMFSNLADRREVHPELYDAANTLYRLLFRVIKDGQKQGAFAAGDALAQTTSLWAAVHGMSVLLVDRQIPAPMLPARPTQKQTLEFVDSFIQIQLNGIRNDER